MTDAPERIWLTSFTKDQYGARLGRGTVSDLDHNPNPDYPEYSRADIHAEAIEAAEQRGYARGIEAAVEKVQELAAAIQGDADAVLKTHPQIGEDRAEYADDLRDLIKELRAISPTPPAPVTVQAAAQVILREIDRMREANEPIGKYLGFFFGTGGGMIALRALAEHEGG